MRPSRLPLHAARRASARTRMRLLLLLPSRKCRGGIAVTPSGASIFLTSASTRTRCADMP
eukprot:3604045-Prymnesium_polylepis.1